MAKYIKSKFKVLWGTVFAFFYGVFINDIVAQENDNEEKKGRQWRQANNDEDWLILNEEE